MIPKVNETYHYFDDGKITLSRRDDVIIKDVIPFKDIDEETLTEWENENCPWLYNPETDFFIKGHLIESKEDVTFVRTLDKGWFSLGWWAGRLDIDGSLNERLTKTQICPVCHGEGEVQQTDIDWDDCRRCDGTGEIHT